MKKLIIFCLSCIILLNSYAQDNFWYFKGEKHYFEISSNEVIIKIDEKMGENAVENSFRKNTSLQISEISGNEFKLVRFSNANRNAILQLTSQWKSNDTVLFVGQVIIDEAGIKTAAITNQINVRLKDVKDFPILQKAVATYDIVKVEQDEFDSRSYLLVVNYFSEKSALQIANELYETGLFEFAAPNLLLYIRYATNDTHYAQQWGLHSSVAGIRAPLAWNITTGSPNIRIAILDSGIDLAHPDLAPNLIAGLGFDATGGNNGGNHSVNPHGTAVAGVAAARGNNSRGIAGVAYDCSILPIHMGDQPLANRVAAGLNWAIANDARVINMSFNTNPADPAVNAALDNATNAQIVLVACSHNQGVATVTFPANRQDVIAVGAITSQGVRAQFSNHGPNLDVVAPGVNIYTTGVAGFAHLGYNIVDNGANGVYYSNAQGTSFAAPHVSGIAALILSVRPDLTALQVRDAIEMNCRRLSAHPATGNGPNGKPRDDQTGYGLVDAFAAIKSILPTLTCTSTLICYSGGSSVISADIVPAGSHWASSSNLELDSTTGNLVLAYPPSGNNSSTPGAPGWVSLNFGSVELARIELWLGQPEPGFSGPEYVTYRGTYYGNSPVISNPSFEWIVTPELWYHDALIYSYARYADIDFLNDGKYQIQMIAMNSCGANETFMNVKAIQRGSSSESYITIYPNPASDVIHIEIDSQVATGIVQRNVSDITFEVCLYDVRGNLLRHQFTKGGVVQFRVSDLPMGIYYLHVYDGVSNIPEIQQVIIER